MNTARDAFKDELCRVTRLVSELIAGATSLPEFLLKYDNFYYRCGLAPGDIGDVGANNLGAAFGRVVELHRRIQDEVIGRIFIATEGIRRRPSAQLDGSRRTMRLARSARSPPSATSSRSSRPSVARDVQTANATALLHPIHKSPAPTVSGIPEFQ